MISTLASPENTKILLIDHFLQSKNILQVLKSKMNNIFGKLETSSRQVNAVHLEKRTRILPIAFWFDSQ